MKLIDDSTEDKSLPFVGTIIAAIVIGLIGVFLRFADFKYSSPIADVIFAVATLLVFKTIFDWLKVPANRA